MLIEHLPKDSALVRSQLGFERAVWVLVPMLLAFIGDRLAEGNWQRQGKKSAKKPKPIPRPGIGDDSRAKRFGTARHTVAEMRLILDTWSE